MLTRLDKTVIWLVVAITVPSLVFGVAIEQPVLARCTQVVVDALEHVDPLDRNPPATLLKAIHDENWRPDFAFQAARWAFWKKRCNGAPRSNIEWRLHMFPVSWWMRLRFRQEDLVGLYVSQTYLGNKTVGFASAARLFYGRELDALTSEEQRCLARRARAPNYLPKYACNGK